MPGKFRPRKPAIDATRLCGAADAILNALETEGGRRAVVRVLVIDPNEPGQASGYSLAELTEGMTLLLRLGIVEPASNQP